MPVTGRVLVVLAALAMAASTAPAQAQQPTTTRASLSSTGAAGNGGSWDATVSADGRYVVFHSDANNLVPSDTNTALDVFLRDRVANTTRRLDVGPGGVQANAGALFPEMSADGRLVLFASGSNTLVPGVSGTQLYLADTVTGGVRKAATLPDTHVFGDSSDLTVLSRDGSRLLFLAYRKVGGLGDVFTADTATGTTRRVTQTAMGTPADGDSFDLAISGDGRWAAFTSASTNLATPDANGFRDIVVADLTQPGSFQRASVASGPATASQSNLHSSEPALSFDGCVIAFRSDAANLVAPDPGPGVTEVFARNRCTLETEVVSKNNSNTAGTAFAPSVSDDGRLVTYASQNVSPPPGGMNLAVVTRDLGAGLTSRLDLSTAGEPGNGGSQRIRISGGTGRYVAFDSTSSNLVAGDDAGLDVFVRDRAVNAKPIAELSLSLEGRRVTADARASRDPDGPVVSGSIAWGDGTPDSPGVQAQHEYTRGGVYAVTVTVTDSDGSSSTKAAVVTIPDPPTPSPGPGPGAGSQALSVGASLSRRSFGVVPRGRRPSGRRGATLRLTLNDAATVRLTFERRRSGRRRGGRCVVGGRRGTRCTRYVSAGAVSRTLPAGAASITLTGRIGSRTLAPGAYRVRIRARTADGRSAPTRTVSFSIIRVR